MRKTNMSTYRPLLLSFVLIAILAVGYCYKTKNIGLGFLSNQYITPTEEVIRLIQQHYVDPIQIKVNKNTPIDSIISLLDPHSVYLSPNEVFQANSDLQGNFKGLGISFKLINDTVNIINVVERGPAAKAGLSLGDKIIQIVNYKNLVDKSYNEDSIQQIMRSSPDKISIRLLRNNVEKIIQIEKGNVPLPALDASYMIAPTIGYIRLSKFSETAYKEFMFALENLKSKGLKKLILDLRDNPGGLLDQAVNIADEFLSDNKLIVYTQGNKDPKKEYFCKREGLFETGPLTVLVDDRSASASEVLAGALQDWNRATIIGSRTFGKGLVQEQFTLNNKAALRLTIARYYTPLGRNIQKPYRIGKKEDYFNEINNRHNDSTSNNLDSAYTKGKAYKTANGKILYDGGGISPDIFVSNDSLHTNILDSINKDGQLRICAYQYFQVHQSIFSNFKTLMDYISHYIPAQEEWNYIHASISKINAGTEEDKIIILSQFKSMIAELKWGKEGYQETENISDNTIHQALLLLEKEK